MIVLVCGGRNYVDRERVFKELDRISAEVGGITELIHGACGWDAGRPRWTWCREDLRGADRFADSWAVIRGVCHRRIAANWTVFKRRAGPIRNTAMLRNYHVELVIAFPGGTGTADCVRQARALGIEVREVVA